MPGRRLSFRERIVIAEGLAREHSCARIARELARPTSTISREVLRYGGVREYDPVEAHGAARERVQRPRGRRLLDEAIIRSTPRGTSDRDNEPGLDAVLAFERHMASTLVDTGMARVPSRVLAALHVTDAGCLTSAELARRLDVSRASISRAVRHLEEEAIIRRGPRHGRRGESYALEPEAWYFAVLASAERNRVLARVTARGASVLGPTTQAGARLAALSEFQRNLTEDIAAGARRRRRSLTAPRPGGR